MVRELCVLGPFDADVTSARRMAAIRSYVGDFAVINKDQDPAFRMAPLTTVLTIFSMNAWHPVERLRQALAQSRWMERSSLHAQV
jgi:hypothetical protein